MTDGYENLTSKFDFSLNPNYANLVNPSESKTTRFDRWFVLKEGYSSNLIVSLLNRFSASKDDIVLDPFVGTGSTLNGARLAGIKNATGIEINPFLSDIASGKINSYSSHDIQVFNSKIGDIAARRAIPGEIAGFPLASKIFGNQLPKLIAMCDEINKITDVNIKRLFRICLGSILEKASHARRDGNGLKYPKNKHPSLLEDVFLLKAKEISQDISMYQDSFNGKVINADSRVVLEKLDLNPSFVIFSPPYLNCFDYTEIYKIELHVLGYLKASQDARLLRESSLSSHLNKSLKEVMPANEAVSWVVNKINWDATFGKNRLKNMVLNYFKEMASIFHSLKSMMKRDGMIIIVVGNSAYNFTAIPTDLIFARMLELDGFTDIHVEAARKLSTSTQQMRNVNNASLMRESLVIARN